MLGTDQLLDNLPDFDPVIVDINPNEDNDNKVEEIVLHPQRDVPKVKHHPYPEKLHLDAVYIEKLYKNDLIINEKNSEGIIVQSEGDRSFRFFGSPNSLLTFLRAISPEQRIFHEKIYANQPQKLRLDIDDKNKQITNEDLELIADAMQMALLCVFNVHMDGVTDINQHARLLWCDSSDDIKTSWHVIVDGFYVTDHTQAQEYANYVCYQLTRLLEYNGIKDRDYIVKSIDTCIYKSSQGLRLAYNRKNKPNRAHKTVPKTLDYLEDDENEIFKHTLITYVDYCQKLTYDRRYIPSTSSTQKNRKPLNVNDQYIEDIIKKIPPQYLRGVRYRNHKGVFINFDNEHDPTNPCICPFSDEIHHHDNILRVVMCSDGSISIQCRHHSDPKNVITIDNIVPACIIDAIHATKVVKTGATESDRKQRRLEKIKRWCDQAVKIPMVSNPRGTIDEYSYDEDYANEHGDKMNEYPKYINTLFIKAQMGTGKTQALKRYIQNTMPINILVASFRKSFTLASATTFGLEKYMDVKGDISRGEHPKIVVQLESFHRLTTDPYELLILDEIESLKHQCFAATHQHGAESWKMFEYMIRHCEKVVCMDANLSQETIDLINDIREDKSHLVVNKSLPKATTHYISVNKHDVIQVALRLLTENKRIVIPTSVCKIAEELIEFIRKKFPDKIIKGYTGNTSEEVKAVDLADVNTAWADCDVLVYTPTIMAGLSFTLEQFDVAICFWSDESTHNDNCLQMMRRVRNISSGTYYHYIKETYKTLADSPQKILRQIEKSHGILTTNRYVYDENLRVIPPIVIENNFRIRAWSHYMATINQSKNKFMSIHINSIKLINGITIPLVPIAEVTNKQRVEVNKALKTINLEINTKEYTAVSEARELSDEEYDDIKEKAVKTVDDVSAMKKYQLRRRYNFNPETPMTFARVKMYCEDNLQEKYLRRRQIEDVNIKEITIENIRQVVIEGLEDEKTPEAFNRMFSFHRHKICLDFINMFGMSFRSEDTITKEELLQSLHDNHQSMVDNFDHVKSLFRTNLYKLPLIDDRDYLKIMLGYINGKLKIQYGVVLKNIKHTDEFKLEDSFVGLFNDKFHPIK